MADWTTIQLNLRYHWKTAFLWVIGVGGALALLLCTHERAEAWVQGYQPFPDDEIPQEPVDSDLLGFLENPRNGSSRSGVGIISGWVCEATEVQILITREDGQVIQQEAAYGTERTDTRLDCGDTDNGFGLLFNWNLLGEGVHEIIAEVDGRELDRATITVTTLDGEFPKGLSGRYVLENFPYPGQSVVIEWEQSLQNFVITELE